jgi:YbbR domain-containing protein
MYSIISLLIAIAAWVFVVYNYDPMTEVRYKDVPIQFEGEAALAERGYAVAETSQDSIYVDLNQRRIATNKLSAEDIDVVADVSNAVIGDNGISLLIYSPDSTTVSGYETRSISVKVEDAASRDMEIDVEYKDAEDTGVEPIVTEMSSSVVRVIAAESVIDKVDKVVSYLAYNDVIEKNRSFTTELVAIDKMGEILPHVLIYPGEITYKASAGTTKSVKLVVNFKDDEDSSYERTYTAPETILIKGPEDAVGKISKIETTEIDARYLYEDTELELEYVLPEGIVIANADAGKKIRIKVAQKEPEETEEVTEGTAE